VLAAADVLLVSDRSSVRDMSLPSKLTSYFAAGRPVLAVTRANSCTGQELARAGAGIQVPPDKPTVLLEALAYLRREPDMVTRLGAAGSHYARNHLGPAAALDRAERFVDRLAAGRPVAAPSAVSTTWHGPALWWRS
jgi:glycosyltransferase involved in cell wall biosynthesis